MKWTRDYNKVDKTSESTKDSFRSKISNFLWLMSLVLFFLWALFDLETKERSVRQSYLVRKRPKKKKKKRRIHTFTTAFPPVQETTSYVVRLQFFRLYEPLLQSTITLNLHLKLCNGRFSQLMPYISSEMFGFFQRNQTVTVTVKTVTH